MELVLDAHIHTSEGSIDSRISIFNTIERLKHLEYNSLIVTDHDSYNGYNSWKENKTKDFIVIKGIEYDTIDAGHMIIVVPSGVNTEIFTLRGLKVETLIDLVHKLGGIIGPAHPYGYNRLGVGNNPRWYKRLEIFNEFDFIEGFNSCVDKVSNKLAQDMAKLLNKPQLAGSDSHKFNCLGTAKTVIQLDDIDLDKPEDSLIKHIKLKKKTEISGEYYNNLLKRHTQLCNISLIGFYGYNRIISLIKANKREKILREYLKEICLN